MSVADIVGTRRITIDGLGVELDLPTDRPFNVIEMRRESGAAISCLYRLTDLTELGTDLSGNLSNLDVTYAVTATDLATTYTVTIDGVAFDYTPTGLDTNDDIALALRDLINANLLFAAALVPGASNQIRVKGAKHQTIHVVGSVAGGAGTFVEFINITGSDDGFFDLDLEPERLWVAGEQITRILLRTEAGTAVLRVRFLAASPALLRG